MTIAPSRSEQIERLQLDLSQLQNRVSELKEDIARLQWEKATEEAYAAADLLWGDESDEYIVALQKAVRTECSWGCTLCTINPRPIAEDSNGWDDVDAEELVTQLAELRAAGDDEEAEEVNSELQQLLDKLYTARYELENDDGLCFYCAHMLGKDD